MSRDRATLLHIANAARLIHEFIKDLDATAFLKDPKTQSAVLHQLLVIGEAVKRLSARLRSAHADIPWRLIAGMRDKIILPTMMWTSKKSGKPLHVISASSIPGSSRCFSL